MPLKLHADKKGKIEIRSKVRIGSREDISKIYTPGVAEVSSAIAADKSKVYDYTIKSNTVAIVTDGSAVLGLGDIGPEAALPVMEGKAVLFKELGDIDAIPICLATKETGEIVSIVKNIAPAFGGINLEDISAPRCFEIEERLQGIGIPVFHDDQHGTAIVVLASILNSAKLAGKDMEDLKVVISGAGAAGTAIARLLLCLGIDRNICTSVKEIIITDSRGIIYDGRPDLFSNRYKQMMAGATNKDKVRGALADAMKDADVFIGVSAGNIVSKEMIKSMADKPIIFALANPIPEIMPADAIAAGAFIVGTGRSDYPNQINNALAFPGIFRGALDVRARQITDKMKIAAAHAIADSLKPSREKILPEIMDRNVPKRIADAVKKAYND
jgi:malate dehydrogenase (oxaloacetate-decarboxylating)